MDSLRVGGISVDLSETQGWGLLGYHDGREALRSALKARHVSTGPYQEFWEIDIHYWQIRQGQLDRAGLPDVQEKGRHVYAAMFRDGWDAAFSEARLDG